MTEAMSRAVIEMYNALRVITESPPLAAYLEANDPKALAQVKQALAAYVKLYEDRG